MAAGRLISRNVAVSRKVSEASDWAFRVWATCLPFCDKHGRLPFDEVDLAAICFSRMVAAGKVTRDKIAAGREELLALGLWKKTGDGLIEIVAFKENQSNQFRPDRETRGTYVVRGGSAEEVRSDCGVDADNSAPAPPPLGRNLNLKEKGEKEEEDQARAREDTPPLERPAVSGSKRQEAAMLAPALEAAFRIAFDSPHWILTDRHKAKLAPYAGLISSFADLPAAVAAGVAAVRAHGADERWIVENVIEYLAANPKAGREPRPTNGKPEPDFVPSWIVDLAEEEGISVDEWKARNAR